jgi:hypothetical protein
VNDVLVTRDKINHVLCRYLADSKSNGGMETLEEKIARVMKGISTYSNPLPGGTSYSRPVSSISSRPSSVTPTTNMSTPSPAPGQLVVAGSSSTQAFKSPVWPVVNRSESYPSAIVTVPSRDARTEKVYSELPVGSGEPVAVSRTPVQIDSTRSYFEIPPDSVSKTPRPLLDLPPGTWSLSNVDAEFPIRNSVCVRVRPFVGTELSTASKRIISLKDKKLIITNPNSFDADPDVIAEIAQATHVQGWATTFKFDRTLWSCTRNDASNEYIDQAGVHRNIGSEIVDYVLNGISATCIAYGHTGAGKTYTLFGEDFNTVARHGRVDGASPAEMYGLSDESGLVPRVITDVINSISRRDGCCDDTRMTLSFLEIYNDKIRDLLSCSAETDSSSSLKIREHPTLGPYVDGLVKVEVAAAASALNTLLRGMKNRSECQNCWNINSSRSHVMVILELVPIISKSQDAVKTPLSSTSKRKSLKKEATKVEEPERVKLIFVDLAGSERDPFRDESIEKSGVMKRRPQGKSEQTLGDKTEFKLIRSSLSSLGFIIKAISKGSSGAALKGLPFRDNVLTHLLKDSFCTRNFISCIAAVSPSPIHYEESISTLKFVEEIYEAVHRSDHRESGGAKSATSEYERLQTSLGADQPGSAAAKLIFQATVSDPQQRMAKYKKQFGDSGHGRHSSLMNEAALPSPNDTKAYDELRSAYRMLQGQLVELQIELDTARTDRDSFLNDLKTIKESGSYSEGSGSNLPLSMTASEEKNSGEINCLREIISRKEDMIEKLLADLTDSKGKSERLAAILEKQKAESSARVEKLQR